MTLSLPTPDGFDERVLLLLQHTTPARLAALFNLPAASTRTMLYRWRHHRRLTDGHRITRIALDLGVPLDLVINGPTEVLRARLESSHA